jgi:hypothetical protein
MPGLNMREVFTYVCAAMGIFALIFTVYQAANNRIQSAILLFFVFALCGAYVFISQIKAFKVWQVEIQLRERLNEADVILAQLRRVAVVNAKAVYLNVGKGGRFSSPIAAEKQSMLDEIDAQLKALNVSDAERRELSATYLKIEGFDFYMLYVSTLRRYFQFKKQDMVAQLNKNSENVTLKPELDRWRNEEASFKPNYNLFSQLQTYSLDDELGRLSMPWLSEQDQKAVNTFRKKILSLYHASQEKGGLTKDAAEYYDRYADLGGQDKKIIELFGFNPSQLR